LRRPRVQFVMVAEKNRDMNQRKKRIIGIVAIALLLLLTVMALVHVLSVVEWIIADLIVAVVANLILKAIGRKRN
jgi:protein-S-isoprenylcysteine O-methyltransferase Ste14